jgi:protoporphyrin/coproporphyrin ferrochelatase
LSDPRVIEIPPALWKPILYGVVLSTRPAASAKKYKVIWTKDGSPLRVHSMKQKALLMGFLGQRFKTAGFPADLCAVELGMRYGEPDVGGAIDRLRAANCEKILVVPMYPQYAASTTASAFDAVAVHLAHVRRLPGLRFVESFHADAGYIKALAQNVNDYWVKHGRPDHLVLSFHGLPRRTLDRGDPYHCLCQATARLLTLQSRFGSGEWLKPYTFDVMKDLGRAGTHRVDAFCPGFVADCLETLEEIGIEAQMAFLKAGGKEFHAIPCLNEHPRWIVALADLVFRNLSGWLAVPEDLQARGLTQVRAKALGAKR